MRGPVIFIAAVLLFTSACARAHQKSETPAPTEQIRAVLCAIEQNRNEAAQKALEKLLASDPKNADYQKALVGVQARQVKRGDHSPQNVELIKKTIQGYNDALQNLQLTTDERRWIDSALFVLYGELGDEELKKELLKRAADPQRPAKDRAEAYAVLASKAWNCSFRITSANSSPDGAAIERAETCTNEGLRYANEALALLPDNESALSYMTNLLQQAATLAGLRNNQAQKAAYLNQYNESLKHLQEVSSKAQAQREKESAPRDETSKNDSVKTEESGSDLTELNRENSFAKVASELLSLPVELSSLISPVPSSTEEKQSVKNSTSGSSAQQQHGWKNFAANDDLMLDLPDNVRQTTGGGYDAASEGVTYSLRPVPRRSEQTDRLPLNGILNSLARAHADVFSSAWLRQAVANRYELKFVRSEETGGERRNIYAYSLISCDERKEGVLIVQSSRAHYYTIAINGAGETDPRAQRVITSIRVK